MVVPEPSTLAALADAAGVASHYEDVWRKRHEIPDSALRGVLSCMGFDVADDAAVAASLARMQRERLTEILPPAIVRRRAAAAPESDTLGAGDRFTATLTLPLVDARNAFSLRLTLEDGTRSQYPLDVSQLERIGETARGGERFYSWRLPLPAAPLGYHRLALFDGDTQLCEVGYVCAPARCHLPRAIDGAARAWGPTVQLYALRSERNWGIGDLTDLRVLMEQWAARGAQIVAVNPLHALFPHRAAQASPYSPSSRLFLNVLYLDVERIDDFAHSAAARAMVTAPAFQASLQRLRASELVDYDGIAGAKLDVLGAVYDTFRAQHLGAATARARAFREFQAHAGRALRLQALFETLQEDLQRQDPSVWGWPVWPENLCDPDSADVARFERAHLERVEFFEYLQWQAELQLNAVAARARELDLGIGLYGDLAVSIDRGGGEAWASQALYALCASVGAPPDEFNMAGQNWGLPPLIPHRLRAVAYAPFVATLRRAMRALGALRIDHVMGLMRLYWIPDGASAAQGAYVHYPLDDLLGILALESVRNRCMVVGEDLGTVPDDLRAALDAAGVLSYRLLYFERDDAGFYKQPEDYPAQALVAASTHDLPTLAGFWEGRDLALRSELGLFPTEDARNQQVVVRAEARAKLLLALERARLLPAGASVDPQSVPAMTPALSRALHAYLARTPAKLMLVQLEDVLEVTEQMNLPGTVDTHPNWRRKLPLTLERWPQDDRFVELCATLRALRGEVTPRSAESKSPRTAVIPRATYRLQLNRAFTLAQACALVPYLARLGISHVYCSPYLRARAGSTHGYDIVDHASLNPEIGDDADLARFVSVLREHGMGQILDIVPNHMGVMGADNAWWLDVLENGEASIYADFFDIDWQPLNRALQGRVLIPVLGEHYGLVLERGELKLAYDESDGGISLWYFTHRFPIDPSTYPIVLERAMHLAPTQTLGEDAHTELASLIAAFAHLPRRDHQDTTARSERRRDTALLKRRLAGLLSSNAALREGLDAALGALNGTADEARSVDALHELIDAQAYRLAYWRVASDEINYRRFFDINDLAALRMENEAVFEATHRRVLRWLHDGTLDGLRIDHPDGLYDPAQYFRRLQTHYAARAATPFNVEDGHWPVYVVAEKITAPHERLPAAWAVHGTTGYDFANLVNGLFVDAGARGKIERIYRSFTGDTQDWSEVAYQGKRLIMRSALASELTVLTNRLLRLARGDRRTRDFTYNTLRNALVEVVACFPVYRTYVTAAVDDSDRRTIDWAIGAARKRSQAADVGVFDFLARVLTATPAVDAASGTRERMLAFTAKLQQFTAPVAAKGVEDTAFYRSVALVSLNEVGGGPENFGVSVKAFHAAMQRQARDWPHTMLATSTHDTKRSEDVRVRIDVLSEMPAQWRLTLRHWSRLNRRARREVDGAIAPSRRDEYLLYQTLLGCVPVRVARNAIDSEAGTRPALSQAHLDDLRARMQGYMLKAIREAKLHTSWINVNAAYEAALAHFIDTLLGRADNNAFLDDLLARARPLARIGLFNSLSQTLIKLTAPGVPDLYRGTETLDLSLVDPDNRRPVDYAHLQAQLDELPLSAAGAANRLRHLLDDMADGRAKLFVTAKLLALRAAQPALFADGGYQVVPVLGTHAQRIVAFARVHASARIVVVAPRLLTGLPAIAHADPLGTDVWGDTALDLGGLGDGWREWLSGRDLIADDTARLQLGEVLGAFPVAVMIARA